MWEKVGKLRNPFKLDLPRSLAQYLVFPGLANTTNTFVPGGLRGPCLMRLYLERHRFFFFFRRNLEAHRESVCKSLLLQYPSLFLYSLLDDT